MTVPELQIKFIQEATKYESEILVMAWVDNHLRIKLRRCDGLLAFVELHEIVIERETEIVKHAFQFITGCWAKGILEPQFRIEV